MERLDAQDGDLVIVDMADHTLSEIVLFNGHSALADLRANQRRGGLCHLVAQCVSRLFVETAMEVQRKLASNAVSVE